MPLTKKQKDKFEDLLCQQNDVIDNAVYGMLLTVLDKTDEELPWDMSLIGPIADQIEEALAEKNLFICRPWNDQNGVPCCESAPGKTVRDPHQCKCKNCPI